jgi:hypothetical protein
MIKNKNEKHKRNNLSYSMILLDNIIFVRYLLYIVVYYMLSCVM